MPLCKCSATTHARETALSSALDEAQGLNTRFRPGNRKNVTTTKSESMNETTQSVLDVKLSTSCKKRGITRDYTPFLLILQGMTLQLKVISLPLPSKYYKG